jgi:hypothetical protein
MGFKMFVGILLLIMSVYFFIGHPETDVWPTALGPQVVKGYKAMIDARPYTTILFFIFGVAALVTIKKP